MYIIIIIIIISDAQIIEVTEKHAPDLSLTKSFSSTNTDKTVFKYVKRTGPSLRSKFVRVKDLAFGGHDKTEPCNKSR